MILHNIVTRGSITAWPGPEKERRKSPVGWCRGFFTGVPVRKVTPLLLYTTFIRMIPNKFPSFLPYWQTREPPVQAFPKLFILTLV